MAPLSNCKASWCWVSMEPILLDFAVRTTANYIWHFSFCCDKIPHKRKVWSQEYVLAHGRRAHFCVSGKAWGERSQRELVTLYSLSGRGGAGTRLAFFFWETCLLFFLFFWDRTVSFPPQLTQSRNSSKELSEWLCPSDPRCCCPVDHY